MPCLAINAHLQITSKQEGHLVLMDSSDYPREPVYSNLGLIMRGNRPVVINAPPKNYVQVESHGDSWTLTVEFGTVQPRAVVWSNGVFYIGATEPCQLDVEAQVYADNLSEPIKVPLTIIIQTRDKEFDLNEIKRRDDSYKY